MPVDNERELRIRKLLNARVSERLQNFRNKIYCVYADTPDCNVTLSTLYDNFVDFRGNHFGDTIATIKKHQSAQRPGKYTVYNYFDNDTLFAFDAYLEKLLLLLSENREMVRGFKYPRITSRTINKSMLQVVDWANRHKNGPETKYYKGYADIEYVYENRKQVPNPITTGVAKTLANKLTPQEIDEELTRYYNEKHPVFRVEKNINKQNDGQQAMDFTLPVEQGETNDDRIKNMVARNNINSESEEDFEYIDYTYYGQNGAKHCKLRIQSDDWFYDKQGAMSIRKIVATGPEGTLMATYKCDDGNMADRQVYTGLLYDEEFNPISDEMETGEEFYPSKSMRALYGMIKVKVGTKQKKSDNKSKSNKSRVEDPNQRNMFTDIENSKSEM